MIMTIEYDSGIIELFDGGGQAFLYLRPSGAINGL